MTPDIRLVAIDLDGTLLDDRKEIAGHVVDAIRCLPTRGVRVVIASARPPRGVRHVYQRLALDTLQVNYNGALIWDEPGQRAVAHHPMPASLVRDIITAARAMHADIAFTCEVLDRSHTDRADPRFAAETEKLFPHDVIAPLHLCTADPVTKLMLLGPATTIDTLQPAIATRFAGQARVLRTDAELIQIMLPRDNKATAVAEVASRYDVPMVSVLAIGDAANDVELLQQAGVGIAMGNACDAAKAVADWIAPNNNDHGVHAALVRYKLCH